MGLPWPSHLVEAGELEGTITVQVEAGVGGLAQTADAVTLYEAGAWGEDGRELAAFPEGGVALLHCCIAVVLEVLEGGGAVGGTGGEAHTGNMASVSVTAERGGRGQGRAPGGLHRRHLKLGARPVGPVALGLERLPAAHCSTQSWGKAGERGTSERDCGPLRALDL